MAKDKKRSGVTRDKDRDENETRRPMSVRARKNRDVGEYDYDSMSSSGRGGGGDHILTREAQKQIMLIRPGWETKFPTTVRILPTIDKQDEITILPGRKANGKLTDWIRGLPAANYIGLEKNRKIHFLLYDPRQELKGYDPDENPYNVLLREFEASLDAEEAKLGRKDVQTKQWFSIAPDSKNRQKRAFAYPTTLFFHQAFVFAHGDKIRIEKNLPWGAGKRDRSILIQTKAGDTLTDLLSIPAAKQGNDGKRRYKYGDVTDLKTGRFVTYFNGEHHNMERFAEYVKDESGDDDDDSDSGDKFNRWQVLLHKEFTYVQDRKRRTIGSDISHLEAQFRERYQWFDDIFHFPTHEELCLWLAQAFRSMPDIIRFCWRDHDEFLTDEVLGVLSARVSGPGAEVPSDEDDDDDQDADDRDDDGDEDEDEGFGRHRRSESRRSRTLDDAAAEWDDDEDEDDDEVDDEDGEEADDEVDADSLDDADDDGIDTDDDDDEDVDDDDDEDGDSSDVDDDDGDDDGGDGDGDEAAADDEDDEDDEADDSDLDEDDDEVFEDTEADDDDDEEEEKQPSRRRGKAEGGERGRSAEDEEEARVAQARAAAESRAGRRDKKPSSGKDKPGGKSGTSGKSGRDKKRTGNRDRD